MSYGKKRVLSAFIAAVILLLALVPAMSFQTAAENKTVSGFFVSCITGRSTYYEGENFSPAGYVGTVLYSDGSAEALTGASLTYRVASPLTEDTLVTFSFGKYTSALELKVINLSSISVSGSCKTEYYAGEDFFDPSGLDVSVSYADSSSVIFRYTASSGVIVENNCPSTLPVKPDDIIMTPADGECLSCSATDVSISYAIGSHVVSSGFPIHVKAVESLEIRRVPSSAFYEGDLFIWQDDDLAVFAKYQGESEARQVYGYTIPGIDEPMISDEDGKTSYTLYLDGVEADFSVTTIPINHFEVTPSGAIQDIYLDHDNRFNAEGIRFAVLFNDGSFRDITDLTVLTYPEVYNAGDEISAVYAGFNIPLSNVVRVHTGEIQLILPPNKTDYKAGETFDITGFTAVIKYDDGTAYVCPVSEFTYEAPTPLSITDSKVILKWKGLTYNLEIRVLPDTEISLNIISSPETVRYINGQPLNLDGLEVELLRSGMEPVILEREQFTTIPAEGEPVSSDTNEIIIRYALSESVYYEASQPIEVEDKKITSIFVYEKPTKSLYNEGDPFLSTGMTLGILYNDGSIIYTRSGFSSSVTNFVLKTDTAEQNVDVIITYRDFSCILTVKVYARTVSEIKVINPPAIKIYSEGDLFNPEGMRVVVYYTENPTVPVTLSQGMYSYYPSGKLTSGTNSVEITFRGLKTTTDIFVEGEVSTEVTTEPVVETSPDDSSDTPITTAEPVESSGAVTTNRTPVTRSPEESTASPETTGNSGSSGGGTGTILLLWIVVIIIIIIALVFLIIYYKRNFT